MSRKNIILIVLFAVFVIFFLRYSARAPKRNYSDFRVYYTAAQRFADGQDIYESKDTAVITPFKYSPVFALLIMPLSLVSIKTASLIFFVINCAALWAILFFSKQLIVKEKLTFRQSLLIYLVPSIFTLRFILGNGDAGQINMIMCAFVVMGLYFLERDCPVRGALLIALSVLFKYLPIIFVPYLLLRKKIKAAFLIMGFVAFYCVLPSLYTGLDGGKKDLSNWISSIRGNSLDRGSWTDFKNQSLYSLTVRTLMKDSPYTGESLNGKWFDFKTSLFISIVIAGIIYLLILAPKGGGPERRLLEYAMLFGAMALFNPNSWPINFVSFLFMVMLIFYELQRHNYKDKKMLLLGALAFILANIPSESFVGDSMQRILEIASTLTISTLILMGILFKLKFQKEAIHDR